LSWQGALPFTASVPEEKSAQTEHSKFFTTKLTELWLNLACIRLKKSRQTVFGSQILFQQCNWRQID
jgi:hypothetical protein